MDIWNIQLVFFLNFDEDKRRSTLFSNIEASLTWHFRSLQNVSSADVRRDGPV